MTPSSVRRSVGRSDGRSVGHNLLNGRKVTCSFPCYWYMPPCCHDMRPGIRNKKNRLEETLNRSIEPPVTTTSPPFSISTKTLRFIILCPKEMAVGPVGPSSLFVRNKLNWAATKRLLLLKMLKLFFLLDA